MLVRYGDTVVLTAAVGTKQAKDTDFFPLTVNYEEKKCMQQVKFLEALSNVKAVQVNMLLLQRV